MYWYDWHTVTERLQGRSYALTRGRPYKVILDPATQTGTCDFTNKQILINPNLFSDVFEGTGLSGPKLDEANFLVSRAITGHEALHVLYSDPMVVMSASGNADLKMVLNLLEDARIEKIGAGMSHVSKTLFGFVNRIAASQLPKFTDLTLEDAYSVLSLLLRWRLGAGIPALDGPAVKTWAKVFRLAQKALYAADCDEVLRLARKIVRILGLNKAKRQDSSALKETEDVMNRMQSGMSGSDGHQPLPNPLTPEDEQQSPESPEDMSNDQPDEDSPTGGGTSQSQEATENQDADQSPDADESAGTEDKASDAADSSSADGEQSGQAEEETSDSDDPDSSCLDPQSAGGESGDEINHQPMTADDIEKLVNDTATQVSEDLSTLVPSGSDNGNDDGLTVAKARPYRGRGYSDIIASPYIHYLPIAAPITAEVMRDLRAENPRAVSGPSQYPGRFKSRYFVRDSAKPFAAQHFQRHSYP